MKKNLFCMAVLLIFVFINPASAFAALPYNSYNYDHFDYEVPSPAAYVPDKSLSGADLGVGSLLEPSDFFVADDGKIYISDSGNNRILIFNKDWSLYKEVKGFDNNGKADVFNNPGGICLNNSGNIYIADSENRRVVVLSPDLSLRMIISDPKSETFKEDFDFVPMRVGVDYADRIYVICRNVFQGIMGFDDQGKFYGFVGTIKVTVSPADIIWRSLATKSQRQKQELYIPTEFTGLDIDSDGFVYTTNIDQTRNEPIKRLNPKGDDVLKKQKGKAVMGDFFYLPPGRQYTGPSQFMDIVVREDGMYSAIDSRRGRVFTYDHEGNLLYIFGSLGTQAGTFKKPVAIETLEDKLLILDQERGQIQEFSITKYGSLINTAVGLRYDGKEEDAVNYWKEVLKLDANFELAYVGIGKSYLAKNRNKEAMKYLKLGRNQKYYSVAYKRYRNEVMKQNFAPIMSAGMIFLILFAAYRFYRKLSAGRKHESA